MRVAAKVLMFVTTLVAGCDHVTPAPQRPQAKGPLRVHAGNPRYLDDGTGKAVLLVGSHLEQFTG